MRLSASGTLLLPFTRPKVFFLNSFETETSVPFFSFYLAEVALTCLSFRSFAWSLEFLSKSNWLGKFQTTFD